MGFKMFKTPYCLLSCQYLYLFMLIPAFQLNEVQLWAGYKEDSWRYKPINFETLQAYYLMGEEMGIIVV